MNPVEGAVDGVRRGIGLAVRSRVAGEDSGERAERIWLAPGPRWFAADSPIARVQGDASMYVGGIRALVLQALHPLAMAGVAGHSGFRGDPWGRLQRTSDFIATTTFGRIDDAERLLARIRGIHRRVHGVAPDGRPYRASDPHLLRWVHVAEIDSFLTAHRYYGAHALTDAEADTYVEQAGSVAQRIGVLDPPQTVGELAAALRAYGSELAATDAARDTVDFLLHDPPLTGSARAGYGVLVRAAISLLPASAREMLDLGRWGVTDVALARPGGHLATSVVRWAMAHPDVAPHRARDHADC